MNKDAQITVDILKGGFVITYPQTEEDGTFSQQKEVFNTQRKLISKINEVVKNLSLVSDN